MDDPWAGLRIPAIRHPVFSPYRLRNSTLYIQSARSYDEGVYVCEASNSLGHSRNTALLRVAGNLYMMY